MGGRHGQPGIAKVENICQVARRCGQRWVNVFPGSAPFPDASMD
jgi:sugar phosphate isomerase/epimerase